MSADGHEMHAMMQSQAESSEQHDCCDDEVDDLACQLICAGVATAIMQAAFSVKVNAPVGQTGDAALGHRLRAHTLSLLRPPTPLY